MNDTVLTIPDSLTELYMSGELPIGANPTELFIEGEDVAALNLALRLYRQGVDINNNLAFLVRFLRYDTEDSFGIPRWAFLEAILYDGVKNREPYSSMNYALSLVETGDTSKAKSLLNSMSANDLTAIAESFWYPVMWKKRNTIEGAAVSDLAQRVGGVEFPEYKEMLSILREQSSLWTSIIL